MLGVKLHPLPLPLALLLFGSLSAQEPPEGADDSIESLLERTRARRDELQSRLAPRVGEIVAELESAAGENVAAEKRLRREIGELGPEALPLFLPFLDPGRPERKGPSYRARILARALADTPSDVLTTGLLQLTTSASPEGQRHAVAVLARQPPDPRIDRQLLLRFQATEGAVRLECIRSLALRGGHEELLERTLRDPDPGIVGAVLEALASRGAAEAAPAVRGLLGRPRSASQVLGKITDYYSACPQVVDETTLDELLPFLLKEEIDDDTRIELLDVVPAFTRSLTLKQRRLIEPILDSRNSDLREAGLVCMALLGQRSARKELIKYYTRQIEEYGGYPKAYEDRADMYLRIREFSPAIKDYKRSLEQLGERAFLVSYRDVWVKLARAQVGANRLRQALETLKEFGLGPRMREIILSDPAFEPLINSRYGRELR